ncbi:MAG: ABC transporter permease [Verrucomicrobia bacterium]|nr:ABC transporter permease [Verrucomicrobiota bacterium]
MNPTITSPERKAGPSTWSRVLAMREIGTLAALVLMVLVIAVAIPQFRQWGNLVNITRNFSFVGIVALGMTLVILTGGIDLSVGSVWGMTAVLTAFLMSNGWLMLPAILVGLLAAAAIGLFNGLCITRLNMSPFVPTLASLSIARALALIITHGRPISRFGPQQKDFFWIGGGDIAGVPNPFILFVILVILFWIVTTRTVWGRRVYAVGGNEKAARLTGLNVRELKVSVYVISALCAGIAGIVQASYLSSVTASLATGQELSVIAATVIGGVNLSGGEGTIFGVVIGTIMLEVLRNGLLLFGIDPYWQGVFVGAIIVVAVSLDRLRKR